MLSGDALSGADGCSVRHSGVDIGVVPPCQGANMDVDALLLELYGRVEDGHVAELLVTFGLSYALLIFAGPLAPYLSYGIAATFISSAVLATLIALGSSLPFSALSVQVSDLRDGPVAEKHPCAGQLRVNCVLRVLTPPVDPTHRVHVDPSRPLKGTHERGRIPRPSTRRGDRVVVQVHQASVRPVLRNPVPEDLEVPAHLRDTDPEQAGEVRHLRVVRRSPLHEAHSPPTFWTAHFVPSGRSHTRTM